MIYLLSFQNPNHKNLYFVLPILCIWLIILFVKRNALLSFFSQLKFILKDVFTFHWLSIIFAFVLIAYGLYLPLSYDESYTFTQFVDRSMFYALCTYPAPNNHIFNSFLSNITWHLLGWTKLALVVRLPSILASCLLLNIFIVKVSKNNIIFAALFLILLLLNLPYMAFAFQTRGYAIQILFAAITFFLTYNTYYQFSFKSRNNLFLFFSVLGMYTSPAYLYVFATTYLIFLIIHKKEALKSSKYLILTLMFFALSIFLLYAPIVVFRGYNSIINNRFVVPLEHLNILDASSHLIQSITEVLGGQIIAYSIFILFAYFTISNRRFTNLIYFLVPLGLMLFFKQTPFTRIFLPIAILLIIISIADLKDYLKQVIQPRTIYVVGLVAVSIVVSSLYFFKMPNGGLVTAFNVKYLSKYFNSKTIYLESNTHDYMKLPIEAYLKISQIEYKTLDTNTHLDKESLLIFSEFKAQNIEVLDSVPSLDKMVYVGHIKK